METKSHNATVKKSEQKATEKQPHSNSDVKKIPIVATGASLLEEAAGETPSLCFEQDGHLVRALGERPVKGALKPHGPRLILTEAINFSGDGEAATIDAVWLLAGGKGVRCEIAGGLRVGGGAVGALPANSLIF